MRTFLDKSGIVSFELLDKESLKLQDQFRVLCDQFDQNIKNCRLNKIALRGYFANRYPKAIYDKIIHLFDFPAYCDFDKFCEVMNGFLSSDHLTKMKFCFSLYDLNSDGLICITDAFTALKLMHDTDYLLSNDLVKLIHKVKCHHYFRYFRGRKTLA